MHTFDKRPRGTPSRRQGEQHSFDSATYLQLLEQQQRAVAALEGHTLQAHLATLASMPHMAKPLASAYLALHNAAELVVSTHRAAHKAALAAFDGMKNGSVVVEVCPDNNVVITPIDKAVDPCVAVSIAAINFVLEG